MGGIIRYVPIDTLPQLLNSLRGEMTRLRADPDYLFFLNRLQDEVEWDGSVVIASSPRGRDRPKRRR